MVSPLLRSWDQFAGWLREIVLLREALSAARLGATNDRWVRRRRVSGSQGRRRVSGFPPLAPESSRLIISTLPRTMCRLLTTAHPPLAPQQQHAQAVARTTMRPKRNRASRLGRCGSSGRPIVCLMKKWSNW